ncbi:MAG: hypothetical protein JWM95_1920 [Gemmatimonadetes bacterium]|nr:hypothetical protein [Gemmatimonadota bacterium]
MAASKAPKDVLELGDHLVHELKFAKGVDTLGRWMSHHVAELIVDARKPGKGKRGAERTARAAILRLWEYRRALPGNAYPLAKYDKVIEFLEVLRPADSPFAYFGRHARAADERAAAELFDSFSRLLATMLLSKVANSRVSKRKRLAQEALSKQERDLLGSIDRLFRLAIPPAQKATRVRVVFLAEEEARPNSAEPDLDKRDLPPKDIAIQWLDQIVEQASALKVTLVAPDPEQ